MILSKTIAAIGVALFFAPHVEAQDRVKSEFTSTAPKRSVILEQSKKDEIDYFRHLCRGFGGYEIIHEGADARSWINIKYRDCVVDLHDATMKMASGSFPAKANDVVEWRGVVTKGKFVPYAIMYRLAGSDEATRRERTRLIVIKLDQKKSAIVGYAQGADEDAKATKETLI